MHTALHTLLAILFSPIASLKNISIRKDELITLIIPFYLASSFLICSASRYQLLILSSTTRSGRYRLIFVGKRNLQPNGQRNMTTVNLFV